MKVTGKVKEIKHHGTDFKVRIGSMQILRIHDCTDAYEALDSIMEYSVSMDYDYRLNRVYENADGLSIWVFDIDIDNGDA